MKINDLNKLEDKISSELFWRKKELSSLKFDIEKSQTESVDKQNRFIRMAIAMLYAHWEGAIKALAEYYLNYVSNQRLCYGELKENFLALALKQEIVLFGESKKASVHNKFVKSILSKQEEQSNIPCKNVISTESNLKMDVFNEIVALLALDSSEYELKKIFIDEKLLANRNRIAHGERFEALEGVTTVPEYLELHKEVLALIDKFSEDIKKAATNQAFKK